jgi:hypothetical protein
MRNMRTSALEEKTVEDVGEFAVRLDISSPTVFQIRSEKKNSPDAAEKSFELPQNIFCETCEARKKGGEVIGRVCGVFSIEAVSQNTARRKSSASLSFPPALHVEVEKTILEKC